MIPVALMTGRSVARRAASKRAATSSTIASYAVSPLEARTRPNTSSAACLTKFLPSRPSYGRIRSSARTRCIAGIVIEGLGYVLAEHRRHDVLGNVSDDAIDRLAILEENQAGYARDLILAGEAGVFVGIQLDELRFAFICRGNLFDDGRKHAARPAPRRPKIDEHRLGALEHLGFKVRLRDVW